MPERLDFDNPWKELIQQFFRAFIEFYFPEQSKLIDWQRGFEFLEQELRQVLREGQRGLVRVDKLVKVWLRDGSEQWILIHIEVQVQPTADFAERTYLCHGRVRDFYGVRVASLAVLADENPKWRPSEYHYELLGCALQFRFASVKLLDFDSRLDWLERQDNPFAVATLAHLQTMRTRSDAQARQQWKLRLVKGLYQRNYNREQILELFRFIDWLMVLPASLKDSFRAELESFERERQMPYVTSIERDAIERGRQEGWQEGRQEGRQALLLRLLTRRFGPLEPALKDKISNLPAEKQESLGEAMLEFGSKADLQGWLARS